MATLYMMYLMHSADITGGVRRWLAERSTFLLALLSCPFCCALWAAAIVSISPLRLVGVLKNAGLASVLWSAWRKIDDT